MWKNRGGRGERRGDDIPIFVAVVPCVAITARVLGKDHTEENCK